MNIKQEMHQKVLKQGASHHSKAFDECISTLLDEIELALTWKRPSILLAVHPSAVGQRKAQHALESKLAVLSKQTVHIAAANAQADLFDAIAGAEVDDQRVYFVDGLGSDPENYRALNLKREVLVEKRAIVLFWLLEIEAAELPRFAPDFWAFRHRVIEFAPGRGAKHIFVPSGLLNWHPEYFHLDPSGLAEQITYQEAVLASIPSTPEAVLLHAEAVELLASHYWLLGDHTRSEALLRDGLERLVPLQMPEQEAKFLNGLAVNNFDQEQYETAYQDLERSLKMNPADINLIVNYGIVQYARGQTSRSVQTVEKAARRHSTSAVLSYVLGYIHLLAGETHAARPWFEKTIQLDSDHFAAHCSIALCDSRSGATDDANRVTEQLKSSDGHTNVYRSICIEALMGDQTAALKKLRSALVNRDLLLHFVQCDPTLHLLLGKMMLNSDA